VVVGSEVEASRRSEERANLQDGSAIADDFGDNLRASSQRVALYAQNEWEITPQWSAYAGLRWEGIATRGTGADGEQPSNRSSVTTPLLHGLWKLSPDSRDQVRISLTRSYRSPTLQNLVARRNPALGENGPTNADRAGNAALRPELATGVDVGIERYIADGGVLSVNLFHRRLRDTIRTVVALETVDGIGPRYVARPRNIGGATTQGIELEAKFRLDQLITDGPRTEMRTNLSLYRSSIDQIPGPDNRLSGQPPGSLNVGADHRFRGTPLSAGATLGWTPGYATRVSQAEFGEIGVRRQWDAYALWRFSPVMQLRLSASNLAPRDDVTLNSIESLALREVSRTVQDTSTNWQARLEFKL
jgi:iron complex outermembrane receptor protein